ncbi:MAG: zinc ribbon domain-containing protein [Burkholderiales bacterium]|nr:zinc ribbon domain-containing protein [Phycisphaerae bacterium]
MALRNCKECGSKVSSKAQSCPGCGAPVEQEGSFAAGCLVIILIIVGVAVYINSGDKGNSPTQSGGSSASDSAKPPSAKLEHNKVLAWGMAKEFVTQNLKSPSSADFGSVWGDYQDPAKCVTDLGSGKYRCVGWVDAQNSFGGQMRNDFVVEVAYVGKDRWRYTSIELAPR